VPKEAKSAIEDLVNVALGLVRYLGFELGNSGWNFLYLSFAVHFGEVRFSQKPTQISGKL
jgi:hypothetical protein